MRADAVRRRPPVPAYHWWLFGASLLICVVGGASLAQLSTSTLRYALDCSGEPDCPTDDVSLLILAPWLDLLGSTVITVTIGVLAARRGVTPIVGIPIGTMVFLLGLQL